MALYLGHTTALKILLALQNAGELDACERVSISNIDDAARREETARASQELSQRLRIPLAAFLPLDTLVSRHTSRAQTALVRPHSLERIPPDSFLWLGHDIYVATPEMCMLQLARSLSRLELIQLGIELCGVYWSSLTPRGFVGHRPLTCPQILRSYLRHCSGVTGANCLRHALPFILDGSASPMETATALILCSARKLGGYGLPKPQLNYIVPLSTPARRLTHTRSCKLDICWPKQHFALEYQGRAYHRDERRDVARELALQAEGYTLQFVTFDQLRYEDQTAELVRRIARALRWQLRPETDTDRARRNSLTQALLPHYDKPEFPWTLTAEQAAALGYALYTDHPL